MAQHTPADPGARGRLASPGDAEVHVTVDGSRDAPAVLLLGNAATPAAIWDPLIPQLAADCRVIRLDLPGCGRPGSPAGGCDIPAQAHQVAAALDRLGVNQVTVVGHSSGGTLATALAEQQPGKVTALALIDTGPSLDAKIPESLLVRLSLTRFPGRLLWRLKTEATIRKSARTGFTLPVVIPDAVVDHVRGMTHRAFVAAMRTPLDYLKQRNLPDRLAALGVPVLVIFGTDDKRWRSSSAAAYRAVPGARVELLPGVGHTPMMEDPQATGALLLRFIQPPGGLTNRS